jgi:beta-glucosidase
LGIGGDQTQHVLWRLDHGNLDGLHPKLAVVMIGTNNAGSGNTSKQIVDGVKAVVDKLQEIVPDSKVLILAIFPRDAKPDGKLRKINEAANEQIAKLADDKKIFYLDIGPKFLTADGELTKEIMPDALHPNAKGYEIWATAIEPTIVKLLGEKS